MAEYIPSTAGWVRDQVELYESSNGTEGLTIGEPPLPVITEVWPMRVREVVDPIEKSRLWDIAVEAYPQYQDKTDRVIPLFIAERTD
jgi:hypothetical protein